MPLSVPTPPFLVPQSMSIFRRNLLTFTFSTWILFFSACVRTTSSDLEPWNPDQGVLTLVPAAEDFNSYITDSRPPGAPIYTPTPDAPHPIPGYRTDEDLYVVRSGDTLGLIAQNFNVSVNIIAERNQITNINILEIGQELIIPAPAPTVTGPNFKIIPDSELVASPGMINFNVPDFVYAQDGYLVRYEEEVTGQKLNGFQIIQRVSQEFSVNPRLLLAVLEYQSGWVTITSPQEETLKYPLGMQDQRREGLYKQLTWAADNLNRGYYWYRANAIASWSLTDGSIIPIDPTINAGTAALQYFFGQLYGYKFWEKSVSPEGFFAVYEAFFGYPFDYTYDPIVPATIKQPILQLPLEPDVRWAFTGGPHGGWGDGSAWAALDFAPFTDDRGCVQSDYWVVAMADGLIVRAENGAVIQDLDNDGHEQTGWSILYMHIESRARVSPGTYLRAGERIGHPSCEGGFSNGTHTHIARRYNGEWIPADQDIFPFVMDGWTSSGTGDVYDGYLTKGNTAIEAFNGNVEANAIQR
jgi:LasA protease